MKGLFCVKCNSLDSIKKILMCFYKCSAYLLYKYFKFLQWCSSGLRSSRTLCCLNGWLLCDVLGYLGGPFFNNLLSSVVTGLLVMKPPSCPRLSATNHPMVQCNISEIRKPHFVQDQNIHNNIFLKYRGDSPVIAECLWEVTEVPWELWGGKSSRKCVIPVVCVKLGNCI